MYAQECYHYKRPDVSNVTWLTPQQLEAARVARSIAPVKVLEIKPRVRTSPDENADTQNILAAAPKLMADAMRKGLAVIHREMPTQIINKGIKKFSLKHRRAIAEAARNRKSTINPSN